jgi:hypothetical protein
MNSANKRSRMVVWLILALGYYVASHLILSRISAHQVQAVWGIHDSFLYVPTDPNAVADRQWLSLLHIALRAFYYPAWQIDHRLFGGPWPMWSMPLRDPAP